MPIVLWQALFIVHPDNIQNGLSAKRDEIIASLADKELQLQYARVWYQKLNDINDSLKITSPK